MSRPTRGTAEITAEVALLLEGIFGMALLVVERAPSMAGRLQVVIELWNRLGSELTTAAWAERAAGTAAPDWTAIEQAKADGSVRRWVRAYVAELWRDDDFALVFERVRGRAVIRANLDGA